MKKGGLIVLLVFSLINVRAQVDERPNIILIICDQLSWERLSEDDTSHFKTPVLDSLSNSGLFFDRAFTMNPTCIPQRISMFTGQRPTKMGIHVPKPGIEFTRTDMVEYVRQQQVATQFQEAGYKTYYGGKTHFGISGYEFFPEDMGFEVYSTYEEYRGADCVPKAIETLENHAENYPEKPFFMVTSLINPHDICYAQIKDHNYDIEAINERLSSDLEWVQKLKESVLNTLKIPEGEEGAGGYEPIDYYLSKASPLPDNFEPQENEPSYVSGIGEDYEGMASEFGRFRSDYDSIDWLLHRYAYDRFVEVIDHEVGALMAGVAQSGISGKTYVIFTSDHGEQNGSHRMAGKGLMYEESVHIPFIVTHPDIAAGRRDTVNLVNAGLDLLPTLFDLAGIRPLEDYEGLSLKPLFESEQNTLEREIIPVEFSTGMGIISKDYFYNIYYNGDYNNEQLIDLRKCPVQMFNEANNAEYSAVLETMRDSFASINGKTLEYYSYPERFIKFLDIDLSGTIDPNRIPDPIIRYTDQEMGMQANTSLGQFIDAETADKFFYNDSPLGIDNSGVIDIAMYRSSTSGLCVAAPDESTVKQYIYSGGNGLDYWSTKNATRFVKMDSSGLSGTDFYGLTDDKLLYENFESTLPANTVKGILEGETVLFKTVEDHYGALHITSFTNSSDGKVTFDMIVGQESTSGFKSARQQNLLLYPNPCENYLAIESGMDRGNITIHDVLGKLVLYEEFSSRLHLCNVSGLADGFYILKAGDQQHVSQASFLKE